MSATTLANTVGGNPRKSSDTRSRLKALAWASRPIWVGGTTGVSTITVAWLGLLAASFLGENGHRERERDVRGLGCGHERRHSGVRRNSMKIGEERERHG